MRSGQASASAAREVGVTVGLRVVCVDWWRGHAGLPGGVAGGHIIPEAVLCKAAVPRDPHRREPVCVQVTEAGGTR